MAITRRHLLQSGAFAAVTPALGAATGLSAASPVQAQTATGEPRLATRACRLFGNIKYSADFKRFDYVNPDAPKGGVVRLCVKGSFDNFNIVIDGFEGTLSPAASVLIFETLMTRTNDEALTAYGLDRRGRRLSGRSFVTS